MRIRALFLAASASCVAAGLLIQACGGDEAIAPVPEAGAPAETGTQVEAGGGTDAGTDSATAKDSAPPCDPTADFTSKIPDASIADGASTTGVCVACAKSKCATEVSNCNKECGCQTIASTALECYAKNPSNPLSCAAGFLSASSTTQAVGLAMFQCLREECADDCAANAFDPDAGDGG